MGLVPLSTLLLKLGRDLVLDKGDKRRHWNLMQILVHVINLVCTCKRAHESRTPDPAPAWLPSKRFSLAGREVVT